MLLFVSLLVNRLIRISCLNLDCRHLMYRRTFGHRIIELLLTLLRNKN